MGDVIILLENSIKQLQDAIKKAQLEGDDNKVQLLRKHLLRAIDRRKNINKNPFVIPLKKDGD